MVMLRSGRLEEKRQQKRLLYAIVGSIGLVVFLAIFGLKILVGFSVLVDRMRGTTPTTQATEELLLPPTLDPLPTATKSGMLTLTGFAQNDSEVIIYLNDSKLETITPEEDGTFSFPLRTLKEGNNTISARTTDAKENTSDLSNVLTVLIKKTPPILELNSPQDHASILGDSNKVQVSGKTEENTTVTVNGRMVVMRADYTFSHDHPLNEGDNKLTIVATDLAGNTTTLERTVNYRK
jgi:hypothetical protein